MKSAAPRRIVLIEDNLADVFLIEQALRDRGIDFELVRYASGDEALLHCCPGPEAPFTPPDLILLDLHLPGTEGHEILRALRAEPRLRDVPVAIISGADPKRLSLTDLSGATRLIRKSMELDVYLRGVGDAVSELLSGRTLVPRGTAKRALPVEKTAGAGSPRSGRDRRGAKKTKRGGSRRVSDPG